MNYWFKISKYRIEDTWYEVPQLAKWAEKHLKVSSLPIKELQQKYIWADKLFTDADEEWTERSMNADLSYPILVLELSDGGWEIIDGNHRSWKAWKLGLETILAYIITFNSPLLQKPDKTEP